MAVKHKVKGENQAVGGAIKKALLKLFNKPAQGAGVTGIALTPDGVSLARIVREGGRPRVTLCVHQALPDERDKSFAALVRQHGLGDARCVELLEVNSYQLLLVEAPNVTPAELKAAVRWRIKDLINFHIDDAVMDVFDIPAQNLSGQSKMMYVVVTRAALVQKHIALAKNAGLDLSVIGIPEMALRNITALFPEDSAGVALVHLTPQGGHIILTREGTLYLARKIELSFARLFGGLKAALISPCAPAIRRPPGKPRPPQVADEGETTTTAGAHRCVRRARAHFTVPDAGVCAVHHLERHVAWPGQCRKEAHLNRDGRCPTTDRYRAAANTKHHRRSRGGPEQGKPGTRGCAQKRARGPR